MVLLNELLFVVAFPLMLRGLAPPPMAFTQEQQRGLFGGNESGAQAAHGQGLVHAVQDAILKQKTPERPMSWQTLAIFLRYVGQSTTQASSRGIKILKAKEQPQVPVSTGKRSKAGGVR